MYNAQSKKSWLPLIFQFNSVCIVFFSFKNDKLPKIKALIPDNTVIIFNNIDLHRHIISDLIGQRVDPIMIGIWVEKEGDILSHGQRNCEICWCLVFQLKHVFMELMSIITASTDFKLPWVESILSFSELLSFIMADLLGNAHFFVFYHTVVLFLLFFLTLFHFLHCIIICYLSLFLYLLEVSCLLLFGHVCMC